MPSIDGDVFENLSNQVFDFCRCAYVLSAISRSKKAANGMLSFSERWVNRDKPTSLAEHSASSCQRASDFIVIEMVQYAD